MTTLHINGKTHTFDIDAETPLLWVLREKLGLSGTKFGCGVAQCGSCTVLVNGQAVMSCVTPISNLQNKTIVTIEGIAQDDQLHPIQQAWMDEQVPECGYCQSGQIMTALSLLQDKANPSDEEIDAAMSNVLCRCGTYQRIRKAIKRVVAQQQGDA